LEIFEPAVVELDILTAVSNALNPKKLAEEAGNVFEALCSGYLSGDVHLRSKEEQGLVFRS